MENKKDKKGILLKVFSIILKLLYYLVISFVCLIAIFLIYYIISSQFHNGDENYKPKISIYTIVSPSMTPVIEVYDVVVNVRTDTPKDIQIGDIITYKSTAPTSDGTILENLELKTNKSNDCVIKVTFKNTGLDQSYNNNKSFKGTYKVVIKE